MQLRRLGNSGVRVSAIGLGSNQFGGVVDQNGVHNILSLARELEINFIDTANAYTGGESERLLGRALRGQRDSFLVATKAFFPVGPGPNDRGASRHHLLRAVEDSLCRLQTDRIDLYQMHRWDWRTPIEQTMRTLDDLVSAGKVRYIGASNYMSWQLAQANLLAQFNAWEPLVSVQSHYHMLERQVEDEVLPFCEQGGLGFIPYFPLAGGFLTGKYTRECRCAAWLARRIQRLRATLHERRQVQPGGAASKPGPASASIRWPNWPTPGCWPGPRSARSFPASPARTSCAPTPAPPTGNSPPRNTTRSTPFWMVSDQRGLCR